MAYQNNSNAPPMQSVSVGPLFLPRGQVSFFEILVNVNTSGNHLLHTASTGMRAMITSIGICSQDSNSVDVSFIAKISGNNYPISPVTTISGNENTFLSVGYILEPSEELYIKLSSNVALNIMVSIIEYPDIYPLKAAKLTSFTGGGAQDVLYTCPAGTEVFLCESFFPFNPTGGSMAICNIGAGACTYNLWGVANGDFPITDNQTIIGYGLTDGFSTRNVFAFNMENAGDTLQISSSSSNNPQIAWQVLLEIKTSPGYQAVSNLSPLNTFVYGPLILGENSKVINQVTNYNDQLRHDLYIVPTGYKALISNISVLNTDNSSAQGVTFYYLFQPDSNFYFITPYQYSIAANDRHNFPIGLVLDEGDVLGFKAEVTVPVNVRICGVLVPRLYPIKGVNTTSAHSTTLYRLPSGYQSVFLSSMPPFTPYVSTVAFTNEDTGPYSCSTYYYDSGITTQYKTQQLSVASKTINTADFYTTFNLRTAGDGVDISTSPFFQSFTWLNLLELEV